MLPSSCPYEICRPLGLGGMAETFVAVRRGPAGIDHTVCLKRVLPALAREPRFVSQFLDEARILSHLRHGNIVSLLDFGQDANGYYMALELVDGVDLAQLLARDPQLDPPLRARVTAYIAASLCRALRYAHDLSIDGQPTLLVHRDISPSNVLLSRHGEVRLSDFGIAWTRGRESQTRTGQTKGKLTYMSPEQVRAEPLDARSDLFSLGVLMHEVLLGRAPFHGRSELELMQRIAAGERDAVPQGVRARDSGLWDLIDSLLASERQLRVQSAAEALGRLRDLGVALDAQDAVAQLVSEHRMSAPAAVTVSHPGLSRWQLRPHGPATAAHKSFLLPVLVTAVSLLALVTWGLSSSATRAPQPRARPLAEAAAPPASATRRGSRTALPTAPAPALTGAVISDRLRPDVPLHREVASPGSLPRRAPPRLARRETPEKQAHLRIAVIPFGHVWIDGRKTGVSPVQIDLAPGKHLIEVGRFDAPTVRRVIQVAGADDRIEMFDLLRRLEEPTP